MTPTPQEHTISQEEPVAPLADGERIVISGMSGLYPSSHDVKELSDILYNKVNPVSSDSLRWSYNHPEAAMHAGTIPDLDRFDAQFFKVHYRLGVNMDPMSRKILEQAYLAIYDAGVNPGQLSGKKIGVFVGSCFSETEKASFYDAGSRSGFGITGCCRAMFANRISYWLNAKGPSMSIDEACCSSTAALEQAYFAMSRGDCEGAIVGGVYLCLHPQSSVHYGRIVQQAMDGKTKSFDDKADGFVKSEAINVLFLQKASDALRVYADLMHAKTQFIGMVKGETGPGFGFLRDPEASIQFLSKFYKEARVPPHAVEYVEAFGSAVPEADKAELEAIDKVFCKGKNETLLVGSVTSNIGYGEAASGINSITKVLLGYHRGEIAANLHCTSPRQDVAALREGRMRIVTEHERFRRTYVAVNGMSITGVNSHVLLHGHYKPKDLSRYQINIPHLVTVSGRQDTAVTKVFESLKSRLIDPEELALLHNIHQTAISGHLGRGFIILKTNEEQKTVSLCEKAEYFDDVTRPLWFVYSGMGSQWAGMGAQLMRIPIFAAAIERCRQALEPKGIDIVHIITSEDKTIFDNILHSFVGIAAIQIGLTDILLQLGLVPDGIIGHSVGELGCAYADGCLTAEEMILSAYSRGLVSLQTPFIRGSMAAIGLGYDAISKLCPPEIEVACHNGPESSTISGPADVMREFVAELTSKGIFAKEVPCSNIAYHSRYIADAGPGLLKYLTEVIKTPKSRSERWVSTSVPEERWNSYLAKYSSAEYHTNNLLNPVLFEETLSHIPNDAILVEVAPHGLLQAILKRSLPTGCKNIALTRRGHPDNTLMLLEAVGKLFMEGYNPKVQILYPKVEMPVSTETPFLSHLVEWAHGEEWILPLFRPAQRRITPACKYLISLYDKEYKYLQGHAIRGEVLYPHAATLVSVWDTLAMSLGTPKKQLPVEFHDVHLYAQPMIHSETQLRLKVSLQRGTGNFEVYDENIKVATGKIVTQTKKDNKDEINIETSGYMELTAADVYDLLNEREYMYSGEFRSIDSASASLDEAALVWDGNWVTLIDGMLQLNALRQPHDGVSLPTHIRRICIDVEDHDKKKNIVAEDKVIHKAEVSEQYDFTRCGGILMETIRYRNLPAINENGMALQTLKFVPHVHADQEISTSLHIFMQMVAENVNKNIIKVVAITNNRIGSVFDQIKNIDSSFYGVDVRYEEINQGELNSSNGSSQSLKETDLVIIRNLSNSDIMSQLLHNVLRQDTFILSEEDEFGGRLRPSSLYRVVSSYTNARCRLDLVRWKPTSTAAPTTVITMRSHSDLAMLTSARASLPWNHRLFIVAPYPAPFGLKDLVQGWRKDTKRNMVYLITVNSDEGSNFFLDEIPDVCLAYTVLNHGILGGEYSVPLQDSVRVSNNLTLQSTQIGYFNSLNWVESIETERGIKVTVHYAGLATRDIKKANGLISTKYASENNYGMDFSGITESGERVMGLVESGAASSVVRARPELLWPVPPHWSLEDAATVPLAYAHAFYCLVIKRNLQPRMSVLVHGGAGALGQATIALALAHDCEVYTTVSDTRKKHFLLKLFPGLKADNIGSSRDHSFRDMVLNNTKGNGCEIVINSQRGSLREHSLHCVGSQGINIDVCQIHDRDEDFNYGLSQLAKERAHAAVDFSVIFDNNNDIKVLHKLISEGISRGYVRPLSRVTYAPPDAARAFRLLATSRHRGRVLLNMTDFSMQVRRRISCNPLYCQLVLLDEDASGLQLVERLIARGARKLHIHHHSLTIAKFQYKLRLWEKIGVHIQISSEALNNESDVITLFNNATRLGSIQGVYAVTKSARTGQERIFSNLDTVSRRFCPNLRHFAIINMSGNLFGQNTCLARVQNKLPATMLTLSKFNYKTYSRQAVDATERALCGTDCVVVARETHTQRLDILKQISELAGLSFTLEDIPKSTTLKELGITRETLQEIASFLRVYHNVEFTEAEIPLLTIETILHVEKKEKASEHVTGLATFVSHVDSDELQATTDMVILPTQTAGNALREDEFDGSQTYLCIVPGIEGHYERFRLLCERLRLPALVLQPGLDRPQETVQETAQRFTKVLLNKTGMKNCFYLLGYETGILIALEMAAILEDHGLTGTVYCLGCEPDAVKTVIGETLKAYETQEHLQNEVVKHMFKLMLSDDTIVLERELKDAVSWPQKVEVCVQALLGRVPHSAQHARALIVAALARIERARDYEPRARALRSQLVLLRAATAHAPPPAPLTMQQYSQLPIAVHQLQAPLADATRDISCASIINEYLDPANIEEFDKINICDSYLLNPHSYVSKH